MGLIKSQGIDHEIQAIEQLLNLGHYQVAATRINRALKTATGNDSLLMLKGVLVHWLRRGDAQEWFQRAHRLDSNQGHLLLYSGLTALEKQQWASAKEQLLEYLSIHANSVIAQAAIEQCFKALANKAARLVTLLRLAGVAELNDSQLEAVFALSPEVTITAFSQAMIKGLISIVQREEINAYALSHIIGNYLLDRYKIHQPDARLELAELCNDELLLHALPQVRLCNTHLELLLTTVRETMLLLSLQRQELNEAMVPLVRAIALQNHLTEYVSYIKDSERQMLAQAEALLEHQVAAPSWQPNESAALLLLLSMYRGLHELSVAANLRKTLLEQWPDSLQSIARLTLFDIAKELAYCSKIAALTAINNSVSQAVQNHYEQNPYPRWTTIKLRPLPSIGHLVLQFAPQIPSLPQELFNPATPVLIAGCGTGQQAAATALRLPQAKISAVDISRRSLAYAELKVRALGINNIEFKQGDILELPDQMGPFYYAECCGVLHHMENPLEGWRKLRNLLAPGGLLKISLYSSVARQDITAERKKIQQLGLEPVAAQIRRYRQALLQQQPPSKIPQLFMDFYSLSECRDLLFHQHETCFTWPQIEQYCAELNMEFLGVFDHTGIQQSYFNEFPDESHTASFLHLQALENKHPYTFRSMYQFLVQKPTT